MKRKVLALMLAAVMSLALLAGCGGDNKGGGSGDEGGSPSAAGGSVSRR